MAVGHIDFKGAKTAYVTIGGVRRDLLANGLSPVLFRRTFKKDFLSARVENQKDNGAIVELYGMMAFIMSAQYDMTREELFKLTMDDYYDWLEELAGADIENNVGLISAIYEGNEVALSDPKDVDA